MSAEPYIRIEHLGKRYSLPAKKEKRVFEDICLRIEPGEFVVMLGPSGCGKSTFLRCLAGFEPYEGLIAVAGRAVLAPSPRRMMMFQETGQLFPWKTALQNVTYPLRVNGWKKTEAEKSAAEQLARVGLAEYAGYYPHQLSGGMRQRVALARILALKPELVLMDEPFASLDAITREDLQTEVLAMHQENRMNLMFVTHNIQEAMRLGTRILVMGRGGTIAHDENNPLVRPVSPGSPGYGKLWERLSRALQAG